MDDKNPTPLPQPVRVQVVLDDETLRMADESVASLSTPERAYNRSSIIRKWIRSGYRREQRRRQQLAERQAA